MDELTQAASELTTLEKFSPYIMEAYLRGRDWEKSFADFYRINSPRFQGFRAARLGNSVEGGGSGRGFDLQMQIVHNEFLITLETLMETQLSRMDVSVKRFLAAAGTGLEGEDAVPGALLTQLQRYADFYEFGEMMEDQFRALYSSDSLPLSLPISPTLSGAGAGLVLPHYPPSHSSPPPLSLSSVRCTRVLWDIENVSVPRQLGGLLTVKRLLQFLTKLKVAGQGIDCRITAFFNPAGRGVSKTVVSELDRAAVEMVWVSGKREDADRKLGNRIVQEMQVLSHETAVFVVVTSDLDFRHHFQLLRGRGFRVLVIHRADTGRPQTSWSEALSMHADEVYHWDEVLAETETQVPSEHEREGDIGSEKDVAERRGCSKGVKSRGGGGAQVSGMSHADSAVADSPIATTDTTQWLPGVCTKWVAARGFGFVGLENAEKDMNKKSNKAVTVFVHISVLSTTKGDAEKGLRPGDRVLIKLGNMDKQDQSRLRASAVRLVTRSDPTL